MLQVQRNEAQIQRVSTKAIQTEQHKQRRGKQLFRWGKNQKSEPRMGHGFDEPTVHWKRWYGAYVQRGTENNHGRAIVPVANYKNEEIRMETGHLVTRTEILKHDTVLKTWNRNAKKSELPMRWSISNVCEVSISFPSISSFEGSSSSIQYSSIVPDSLY